MYAVRQFVEPVVAGADPVETHLPDMYDGTTSIAATKWVAITLGKQGLMEFVDSDIFVVDGDALGFLGLGHHPRVLSVCPETPMELHDVLIGDALCHIDGMDTRDVDRVRCDALYVMPPPSGFSGVLRQL